MEGGGAPRNKILTSELPKSTNFLIYLFFVKVLNKEEKGDDV
jgi:hypothetical protein